MKRNMLIAAAALSLVLGGASLGSASATDAAPKPGFVPGKWIVMGKISGSTTDAGVVGIKNRGQFRFTLLVAPDRAVSGSGTWKRTMTGAGFDTKVVIVGTASLKFSGPSRDAAFTGLESATGTIWAGGVKQPIDLRPVTSGDRRVIEGVLVVARAGDCTANGTADIATRPGLKLKWTAKRVINGTCNA